MSGLRQNQRPAIDSLIKGNNILPLTLRLGQLYFLNGKQIFLAGVSEGIGTCTDPQFRGINIAVFTETLPGETLGSSTNHESKQCHGAVFLRKRDENELDPNIDVKLISHCLAVEWLEVKYDDLGSRQTFLESSGKSKLYVPII